MPNQKQSQERGGAQAPSAEALYGARVDRIAVDASNLKLCIFYDNTRYSAQVLDFIKLVYPESCTDYFRSWDSLRSEKQSMLRIPLLTVSERLKYPISCAACYHSERDGLIKAQEAIHIKDQEPIVLRILAYSDKTGEDVGIILKALVGSVGMQDTGPNRIWNRQEQVQQLSIGRQHTIELATRLTGIDAQLEKNQQSCFSTRDIPHKPRIIKANPHPGVNSKGFVLHDAEKAIALTRAEIKNWRPSNL